MIIIRGQSGIYRHLRDNVAGLLSIGVGPAPV
jgi:hypothetical protein